MNAFFSAVFRGVGYGAFMGLGLGTVAGTMSMFHQKPETSIAFQHPVTGETMDVETFGLDGDANVVHNLRRAQQSMDVDPNIRSSARRQFVVILARVRHFYRALRTTLADPQTQQKIRVRNAATAASQSITNLESHIWDSREIEPILSSLANVRTAMIERALILDSTM